MKYIVKTFVIFIGLLFCININATTIYGSVPDFSNDYLKRYNDYSRYLVTTDSPYGFLNNTTTYVGDYRTGGLLNREEFMISKDVNGNTYLFNGLSYWTMTKNDNKMIIIDPSTTTYLSESAIDSKYGVRVTDYVQTGVYLRGSGTSFDPWTFIEKYAVRFVYDDSKIRINPRVSFVPKDGAVVATVTDSANYTYDNNDCGATYNNGTLTLTNINRDTICNVSTALAYHKITYNPSGYCSPNEKRVKHNNPIGTMCTPSKTGYTFKGWYDEETGGTKVTTTTKLLEDMDLYARFEIHRNTLTVNPNGGKVTFNGAERTSSTSVTQNYNTTIAVPNASGKANSVDTSSKYTVSYNSHGGSTAGATDAIITKTTTYTFSSWTNSGTCGNMSGTTYTFPANSGTTCTKTASWTSNTTSSTAKIILPTVTKTGYAFEGWYTAETGGTKIGNAGDEYTPTSNITLHAQWTIHKNTLTVNPNGGKVTFNGSERTSSSSVTQNYNTTIAVPNPTRANSVDTSNKYTVSYNSHGGSTANATDAIITKTTTYTFSSWTNSGTCGNMSGTTYTFPANSGTTCTKTASWTSNTTSSTAQVTLPIVTKTGYTFNGWYTAETGGTKIGNAGAKYTPTANITLHAQWTINQNTLTVNPNGGKVTFNGAERTSATSATKNYNETIAVPNPTRANSVDTSSKYTVSYNSHGGGTASATDAIITKTTTYTFSSWTNSGTCGSMSGTTYTFPANSGTTCTKTASWTSNTTSSTAQVTLPTVTKTGYTLNGWYTAETGGTKIGNAGAKYTPTANITLHAQWTINQNTLTVNPNGGKVTFNGAERTSSTSATQNYNTTIAVPNASGKANSVDTSSKYTVSYNSHGGGTASATDATITKTTTYTFSSWTNSGTCGSMPGTTYTFPANSGTTCTKTASWTSNTTSSTAQVTLPTVTKTGYTLNGWYTAETGGTKIGNGGAKYTPTSNITLHAQWTINQNTLTVNPNGGKVTFNGTERTSSTSATQNYNTTIAVPNASGKANSVDTSSKYTVSYNSHGGGTVNSTDAIITKTTTYTFSSWTNSGTCGSMSGTTYTFPANSGTTCTKTASWTSNTTSSTAQVTLPTVTKTGYTLNGWYTAESGGTKIGNAGAKYTPTANITLHAQWTINQNTLTVNPNGGKVTFNGAERTSSTSATKNYNETIAVPNASGKANSVDTSSKYTVSYNSHGGSTANATDAIITKTTTYTFSSWTNSGTCGSMSGTTYTFPANSGTTCIKTASWTSSTTSSTAQVTLPTPTRSNYSFNGWYTAESGGTKIGNGGAKYTPTANITLHAQWTPTTVSLTWDCNGGSGSKPSSSTPSSGTSVTLTSRSCNYKIDTSNKAVYYQLGWNTSKTATSALSSYTINSDTILYAVWSSSPIFTYSGTWTLTSSGSGHWYALLKGDGNLVMNTTYSLDIAAVGGGGGAATAHSYAQSAGGGGGGAIRYIKNTSLSGTYTIALGAGGSSAGSGYSGGDGGTTTVKKSSTTILSAPGGGGAKGGSSKLYVAGKGGTASDGSGGTGINGTNGGTGLASCNDQNNTSLVATNQCKDGSCDGKCVFGGTTCPDGIKLGAGGSSGNGRVNPNYTPGGTTGGGHGGCYGANLTDRTVCQPTAGTVGGGGGGGSCAPGTGQGDTIYRVGKAGGKGVVVLRDPQ